MAIIINKEKYLELAPADWERTEISKLFKFSSGKARPKDISKIRNSNYPYPVYGGNGVLGYSKEYSFDNPYLILGRVGEYCGCAHLTEEKSWISDNALYSKDVLAEVDFEYFKFFFDYFDLNRFSNKNGQPLITQGNVGNLIIAKPKLNEQKQIAFVLRTLQKAIQKQEEIINTTTALKKTLLNKLFTEGTKGEPLKQTPLGMIPESWQVVPIGSLGTVVTGSTPKTSIAEYYQPEEYDFIAPVDIGKNWIVGNAQKKISSKGLSVSRPLPKNTVLAVCIGSTIGKVGLTSKELSATNQQINAIVCDESVNNPWFVYYLLTFYNNIWKEAATPSPVPILTKGQFEKILIPFTDDLQEQTLMAESLKVFENKLKFHTNKKNIYESIFKTLLNELMTGAIRVNDLDFHSQTSSPKTVTA